MIKNNMKAIVTACCLLPLGAIADTDNGNRYDLDRHYASEISASAAFLATNSAASQSESSAVIIDVRTVEEYVGGHPPGAYSIPFPHVNNRQYRDPGHANHDQYIGQDPADYVAAVNALGLPKDTQIITMCRTGFRSVLAGNLLAAEGYTNVQNMWEGFKGNAKTNTTGDKVDLDGDGLLDETPYSGDLDGWANFAGLPVSYKLKHWKLDPQYTDLYYTVEGER